MHSLGLSSNTRQGWAGAVGGTQRLEISLTRVGRATRGKRRGRDLHNNPPIGWATTTVGATEAPFRRASRCAIWDSAWLWPGLSGVGRRGNRDATCWLREELRTKRLAHTAGA